MHQRSTSNLTKLSTFRDMPLKKIASQQSIPAKPFLPPLRFPPPLTKQLTEEFSYTTRIPTNISRIAPPQQPLSASRTFNTMGSTMRSNPSINHSDLIDENNLTKKPIEALLKELLSFDYETEYKNAQLIPNVEKMRLKKVEAQKKVFSVFEDLLCLYKIRYEIISGFQSDSFMDIDGVTDKHDVVKVIRDIAPLICKFPYSFFRKLKIPMISFCDEVYLHKSGIDSFGTNRAHIKALFPVKVLTTPDTTIDYFYHFIFSNLRAHTPSFDKRLISVIKSQAKANSLNDRNRLAASSFLIGKKTPNVSEEWKTLKDLIDFPSQNLFSQEEKIRVKALSLRIFLEELDPEGINNKWWSKLGCPVEPDYEAVYSLLSMAVTTASLNKF